MTRKVYRTAQGKMVDIGALQLQNENIRAVGNMPVNARGDLVDSMNRPISTKNQQVSKQYNKQTKAKPNAPAQTAPVKASKPSVSVPKSQPAPAAKVEIPPTPEDFDDEATKETISGSANTATEQPTGLAAAIARARQIKQEPLKTPRQAAQDAQGVKKL